MPKALENTPKPLVIVKKESAPNAWVSDLPVQWTIPTRVTRPAPWPAQVEPAPAPDAGFRDGGDGGIADVDAGAHPPPPALPALYALNDGDASAGFGLFPDADPSVGDVVTHARRAAR